MPTRISHFHRSRRRRRWVAARPFILATVLAGLVGHGAADRIVGDAAPAPPTLWAQPTTTTAPRFDDIERPEAVEIDPAERRLASGSWPATSAPGTSAAVTARFGPCDSGGEATCVVDGDTFRLAGEKIRIMGIDTPETFRARCASESAAGDRATARLTELLNAGPFAIEAAGTDRYGRTLAHVTRRGASVVAPLIDEGLARPYEGGRRGGWCS